MLNRSLGSHLSHRLGARLRARLLVVGSTVALLLAALGTVAHAQTTTESLDLIGPVATVKVYQTYEPEDEEPRLRQEWTFSPDGILTERVTYSYSFRDGSLNYRQVAEIDDTGRILRTENIAPDGTLVGRSVHEYDSEGRPTLNANFGEDGEQTFAFAWTYDGDGNLTARETFRGGDLIDRDEFEYDDQGRRIAGREVDGDGNLTAETTYTVPDLEYEVVEYEDDGTVEERSVVVSGEHGALSAETYLPDGTLAGATYFVYREDGLTVERRDIFSYESGNTVVTSESTTVYEYEFDDAGNWIRKVDLEDDGSGPTPIGLEVREIDYH